jgi:membrane protein DedA with SNARE-associated domain
LGTLLIDQFFFYLGRLKGQNFLEKRPLWQKKFDTIQYIMHRYQNFVLISFCFMYGFRTVTPFIIGMSKNSHVRFLIFNITGAIIWSVTFSFAGIFQAALLNIFSGIFDTLKLKLSQRSLWWDC